MPERSFTWLPINLTYGPWFEMKEIKKAMAMDLSVGGHPATVQVIPDMDRQAWFWSVKFHAYRPKLAMQGEKKKVKVPLPEKRLGGKCKTRDEAMAKARQAFLTGRPTTLTAEPHAE